MQYARRAAPLKIFSGVARRHSRAALVDPLMHLVGLRRFASGAAARRSSISQGLRIMFRRWRFASSRRRKKVTR